MESAAQCDQECRIAGWRDFSERHKRACLSGGVRLGRHDDRARAALLEPDRNKSGEFDACLARSPLQSGRAPCWISFMLPLFPCAQLAADSAGSQLTGPLLPARFAPLDVDALLAQLHPLNE